MQHHITVFWYNLFCISVHASSGKLMLLNRQQKKLFESYVSGARCSMCESAAEIPHNNSRHSYPNVVLYNKCFWLVLYRQGGLVSSVGGGERHPQEKEEEGGDQFEGKVCTPLDRCSLIQVERGIKGESFKLKEGLRGRNIEHLDEDSFSSSCIFLVLFPATVWCFFEFWFCCCVWVFLP